MVIILVAGGYAFFAWKKQGNKKNAKIAGLIALAAFVGFGLTTEDEEEEATEDETEEVMEEEGEEGEVEAEEVAEEPEEEEEEEDDSDFLRDEEDGTLIFTHPPRDLWSAEPHTDSFAFDIGDLLEEHADEAENGMIFRSAKTLVDEYGNDTDYNVILVYYSQETIDQINFENWPNQAGQPYTTADGVWAVPAFQEGNVELQTTEDAPDAYYNFMNSEYEE